MIEHFESLSNNEFRVLKNAIAWITLYVAGADDNIDDEEQAWAVKLAKIRSYANEDVLNGFYTEVGKDFEEVLDKLVKDLPNNVKERNAILSDRLSQINDVLPKLDNTIAYRLYKSYTSFAEHVAKSSGGFLRFFSVSAEEDKAMQLDMINLVDLEEEE